MNTTVSLHILDSNTEHELTTLSPNILLFDTEGSHLTLQVHQI